MTHYDLEKIVKATLSADSFWSVNKALARRVGIEEAALTAEIISKHSYWKARKELDDQGGFFMTSADIQAIMGIGDKAVGRLTKSILDQGVVKIKKRGVPAKNYWYPQWEFIFFTISSDPQTGVTGDPETVPTGDPQTVGTTHPQKGVAITKNTYKKNNTKKIADKPLAEPVPSLYKNAIELIGRAHKHLTGDDLIWKGREGRYGKATKQILEIVSRETPEVAFDLIRQKCAAYVAAAQTDKYLKGQGVTPVSIFDSWNKVHYKPNMLRGAFGAVKKEFPKYREMTAEQIKESLAKWNKHFTVLEIQPHISPESYLRFTREANGYAPALVDILIEEVHPQKKTA